jgi:HlyD family secretion protein
MTVSVDIETARHANALLIPSGAVVDAAGARPWVLAVDGHHAVKRPVKLGLKGEGRVEVVDGVAPGDRLVASAGAGIVPGQRVRAALASRNDS